MNKPIKEDYSDRLIPEIVSETQAANGIYVKYRKGKKTWEEFIPFKRDDD